MTHSRAFLLIQREYEQIIKDPPWGIHVRLAAEGNPFRWIVTLSGLRDSLWERGSLVLFVEFDEFYNQCPPSVRFHTIPFHPNIDAQTGEPCLRHLTEQCNWNPNYSVSSILTALQSLLAEPHPEDAVNEDASRTLIDNPTQYKKIVHQCVERSRLVQYDDMPLIEDIGALRTPDEQQRRVDEGQRRRETTAVKAVVGVSFEDYYQSWKGLATATSPLWPSAESPDVARSRSTSSQSVSSVKKTTEKRKKATHPSTKDEKMAAVEKMKKVYLQRYDTVNSHSGSDHTGTEIKWTMNDSESFAEADEADEADEVDEVDEADGAEEVEEDADENIVEWTKTLDETQIDQW